MEIWRTVLSVCDGRLRALDRIVEVLLDTLEHCQYGASVDCQGKVQARHDAKVGNHFGWLN